MSLDSYRRKLRKAARAFWAEAIDYWDFQIAMQFAIQDELFKGWMSGARECGISQYNEILPDEDRIFQDFKQNQLAFMPRFALFMIQTKESGGKIGTVYRRLELWANRYNEIRNLARQIVCKDKKMAWVLGPTEQHCPDCSRYSGRVYRASIWQRNGIKPQDNDLSCCGYNCLCQLKPTDRPVTPGKPPAKSGCGSGRRRGRRRR